MAEGEVFELMSKQVLRECGLVVVVVVVGGWWVVGVGFAGKRGSSKSTRGRGFYLREEPRKIKYSTRAAQAIAGLYARCLSGPRNYIRHSTHVFAFGDCAHPAHDEVIDRYATSLGPLDLTFLCS